LVRKGLTPQEADAAAGDLADAVGILPPATIAALKLADALSEFGKPQVAPELMAELLEHFDHDQILELGYALSVASGWQRMIEAFDVRPDYWSEATPSPQRPPSAS
jgi:alkylhydroperoxidase family enzyme